MKVQQSKQIKTKKREKPQHTKQIIDVRIQVVNIFIFFECILCTCLYDDDEEDKR